MTMTVSNFIRKLNNSNSLTDILIQLENFMDNLDIYVFRNWFDGEVIEGPIIKRYWVSFKLKYDYDKMPEPLGGLRLIKHGAKVRYVEILESVLKKKNNPIATNNEYSYSDPEMEDKKVWIVEIVVPRKYIEELDDSDLEDYDDEIDIEHISDSRDEDMDASDAYITDRDEYNDENF